MKEKNHVLMKGAEATPVCERLTFGEFTVALEEFGALINVGYRWPDGGWTATNIRRDAPAADVVSSLQGLARAIGSRQDAIDGTGLAAAGPGPWDRHLRVTLTLDAHAADDRALVPKLEKALADALERGLDALPGYRALDVDGTTVVMHYHYINRYTENGKRLKPMAGEEGGQKAPELDP